MRLRSWRKGKGMRYSVIGDRRRPHGMGVKGFSWEFGYTLYFHTPSEALTLYNMKRYDVAKADEENPALDREVGVGVLLSLNF